MDKQIITLPVSSEQWISIKLPCQLNRLEYCDHCIITFTGNDKEYQLREYTLLDALRKLKFILIKIFEGEGELKNEIKEDIGYMWNIYLRPIATKPLEELTEQEKGDFIGKTHHLWSSYKGHETWLYTKNGKIYLEITPDYPWHFKEPPQKKYFISYEEFMKKYKPIARIELDRNTAEQWLSKAQEVLEIIKKNSGGELVI